MKLFFALRLRESVTNRIDETLQRLRDWDLPARWTHPQDLHITLCYLGDVPEEKLKTLTHKVDMYLASQLRPRIAIPGLGAFAGKRWPRVVYAAVADEERACAALHADLADFCGTQTEHSFVPHVTLAYPKGQGIEHTWEALLAAYLPLQIEGDLVEDIVLYESEVAVDVAQPRFQVLASWPFID